ncbi:MAG: hypothetical protein H0X24_06115 [Ktedonobacterales bacterium]|nr:hypothetical protein [Ktedonobacterales bacterium]
MFTIAERDHVRARVIALARADARVTAGALTGSSALGAEDVWSDVDVAFGIMDGVTPEAVLHDWTVALDQEFTIIDHFDLHARSSIYRVFLLPSGLEVDIGVTPGRDFGARGPQFQALFGPTQTLEADAPPNAHDLMGLGWHHVLHARSSIERGKFWQAEYWISAIRNYTLALACLRLGENAHHGRGTDRLPADVTAPLAATLVCAITAPELRRALAAATTCLLREMMASAPALGARCAPLLQEFGAPPPTP